MTRSTTRNYIYKGVKMWKIISGMDMVVLIIVIDPCSSACNWEQVISKQFLEVITTAHPWCDGHSTSISVCGYGSSYNSY